MGRVEAQPQREAGHGNVGEKAGESWRAHPQAKERSSQ